MSLWQDHPTGSPIRSHRGGASHDESNWILTYSDMVTLLLAFFIIIASISVPSEEKYREVQESIAKKLGVTANAKQMSQYVEVLKNSNTGSAPMVALQPQESLGGKTESANQATQEESEEGEKVRPDLPVEMVQLEVILNALSNVIKDQGLTQQVSVSKFGNAATVTFPEGVFFGSGEAKFSKQAAPFLNKIASALKKIETPFVVEVEGHTDNRPLISNKSVYPTNWELSTARSTQVVRHFLSRGLKPDQLVAKGFADTRPVAPNVDDKGRAIPENQKKNRRVVLRIIAAGKETTHD